MKKVLLPMFLLLVFFLGDVGCTGSRPPVLHVSGYDRMTVSRYLAWDFMTPSEVLTDMSAHPDPYIRNGVAQNPNTLPRALAGMVNDPDVTVRWRIARNPNTPVEALFMLTEDEDWYVRSAAYLNPVILLRPRLVTPVRPR